jgi:hypothetical protein
MINVHEYSPIIHPCDVGKSVASSTLLPKNANKLNIFRLPVHFVQRSVGLTSGYNLRIASVNLLSEVKQLNVIRNFKSFFQ